MEKATGLLQRAQLMLAENTPSFDVWATKNGLKHAGILQMRTPKSVSTELGGGYYFLAESTGFTAKTIASSLSTEQFWTQTLSKAFEWQCFSKDFNELTAFLDFFDDEIKNRIDALYFLPFKDKTTPMYLMVAELDCDEEIQLPKSEESTKILEKIVDYREDERKNILERSKEIEKGFEISNAHLMILSLKSCVEKIVQNAEIWRKISKIDTVDRIEMKSHIFTAVANAANSILFPMFRCPNCLHIGENGEMKIVMFAPDEPDEEVISFHIATALSPILGKDAAKQILLLSAGVCPNQKGVLAFLKQG